MDEPLPLNIPGWYTLGLLIISDTSSTGEAYWLLEAPLSEPAAEESCFIFETCELFRSSNETFSILTSLFLAGVILKFALSSCFSGA